MAFTRARVRRGVGRTEGWRHRFGALVGAAPDRRARASGADGRHGPGPRGIPELGKWATEQELTRLEGGDPRAKPCIGPRPRIVTRRGWGADESLRVPGFVSTKQVKAAFVHHTASGDNHTCSQAPSVIRSIHRYHVKSMGRRDSGYDFLVDRCGNLYEGRAGGAAKAVLGAHIRGFTTNSMGTAVIGGYGSSKPSGTAVTAAAGSPRGSSASSAPIRAPRHIWRRGVAISTQRGRTYD
ncbi:N-acetylmuramoyl-L-alanine amidase [Streptomyces sp. NPDC007905]|uniref:N-acetylmuramoyl-L-alanine amidase n=1 Tax=Streptomyces sp. NPDC007905 TaxID=3364788 RepID=UPI0036E08725